MKIFFLTPSYMGLYKPILEEMERQGHEVYMEFDKSLPMDPNVKNENTIKRSIKWIYRQIFHVEEKYWKKKIIHAPVNDWSYDLFFCIDGVSFHPYLLSHLKKNNPFIKSVLYLWDTNKYYDFLRYRLCFDKVFTFDMDDADMHEDVELLHLYWIPFNTIPLDIRYQVSMVGSDHDGRLDIVETIAMQLKKANISFNFKILSNNPNRESEYIIRKPLSPEKVYSIMCHSECILDTDKKEQIGVTPRLLWAIAMNKKIITTNTNLGKMFVLDPSQVLFIDREHPIVDLDFIRSEIHSYNNNPIIDNLRLDRWVRNILSTERFTADHFLTSAMRHPARACAC